jgi:uncharacterized membrane protein HdeD (DUF308 family)
MKKIVNRMKKPTPVFFKSVRNVGLVVAAIGTTLLTAPIVLPGILVSIGGYLVVAGGVITAVSQSAVKMENK